LHGRKQIIIKDSGRYEYRREGVLDEVPHIKVDTSVFIVAMEQMRRMLEFFNAWENKVHVRTFPVLVNDKQLKKLRGEEKDE
jgi:hypothetical protein